MKNLQRLVLLVVGPFLASGISGRAEWKLSAGVSYHGGMQVRAEEPASFADSAELASFLPAAQVVEPAANGRNVSPPARDDISRIKDRSFDNGHVGPDQWTTDSGVPPERQNLTWNWSAENPSQYDPGNHTLTFTRTTVAQSGRASRQIRGAKSQRVEYQTLQNSPLETQEDLTGAALDLMDDRVLVKKNRWQGSVRLGLSLFLPEEKHWDTGSAYQAFLRQTTVQTTEDVLTQTTTDSRIVETYVYSDVHNVVPSVGLPYGGPADPWGGPGPLIPALPSDYSISQAGAGTSTSEEIVSSSRTVGVNEWRIDSIAYDLELKQQRLWVNPLANFSAGESFSFFAGPVLSLTFAQVEATRTANLMVVSGGNQPELVHAWADRSDEDAWLPGIGVRAGCAWTITPTWFMAADLGATWMKTLEMDVGPATLEADLGGWQGALQIGRVF